MKLIAIGDIHGYSAWKKIIAAEPDADKIIFIGDYFDNFEQTTAIEQIHNFNQIIALKQKEPDKYIIELGNHDFQYLPSITDRYSGFQSHARYDIGQVIQKAIDNNLMQMCFMWDTYCFTHAGITKTWCRNNGVDWNNDLEQQLNDLLFYKPRAFSFASGSRCSSTGDDITQGPIWVRPRSLYIDKIPDYTFVVGHTQQDKITGLNGGKKYYDNLLQTMYETCGVIFIDTLGTSGEYLVIEDGKPYAKTIKQ